MTPRSGDLVVNRWRARFKGRDIPCSVGRAGITRDKAEGDGATPQGTYELSTILFRPDRISKCLLPARARPVRLYECWSDDPTDPGYNRLKRRHLRTTSPFGHERLVRPDPLYDLLVVVDYNRGPTIPGMGSAIFLHCWRQLRAPTQGCIAFERTDLIWIVSHADDRTRLIVKP